MEEFIIRNQIIDLLYDLLEKEPKYFKRNNDDEVKCTLLRVSSDNTSFGYVNFIITRIKNTGQKEPFSYHVRVTVSNTAGEYCNFNIGLLDHLTAYKFFQTDEMYKTELDALITARNAILFNLDVEKTIVKKTTGVDNADV
jgi:hypothetical protein